MSGVRDNSTRDLYGVSIEAGFDEELLDSIELSIGDLGLLL